MFSGGTIWWQMVDLGGGFEYDCILGLKVILIEEWCTMDSGVIKVGVCMAMIVSEIMTRRGLKHVVKLS